MAYALLKSYKTYIGLSTDTKPTSCAKGSRCIEADTGKIYVTDDGGTNWRLEKVGAGIKTIETELKAITAVNADAQSKSSELDISEISKVSIFIDHAKDAAAAAVGAGAEYRIEVSEKATGDDTWRSIASVVAAITAPTAVATDALEAVGQTVIECGASVPALGDIIFFKNATIANSEWARVVARDTTGGSENFTIQDGLTTAQAASTYYTQGEHFVLTLNVNTFKRLRVVCNNNNGTTNRDIVWRCACISES